MKDISEWWIELYNASEYLSFDPNFVRLLRESIKNGVSKQALFNFVQRLDEQGFNADANAALVEEAANNIHCVISNKIASND